jgi:hypothetical protein
MPRSLSLSTRVRQDGFCCPYMAIKETRHVRAILLAERWRVAVQTIRIYRRKLKDHTLVCENNEICGRCPTAPDLEIGLRLLHTLPATGKE